MNPNSRMDARELSRALQPVSTTDLVLMILERALQDPDFIHKNRDAISEFFTTIFSVADPATSMQLFLDSWFEATGNVDDFDGVVSILEAIQIPGFFMADEQKVAALIAYARRINDPNSPEGRQLLILSAINDEVEKISKDQTPKLNLANLRIIKNISGTVVLEFINNNKLTLEREISSPSQVKRAFEYFVRFLNK